MSTLGSSTFGASTLGASTFVVGSASLVVGPSVVRGVVLGLAWVVLKIPLS